MRVSLVGDHVIVVVSERNLLTLLAKLKDPESARTLQRPMEGGILLTIHAESDDKHYASHKPGAIHPRSMPDFEELRNQQRNGTLMVPDKE